jgi:endonuclease YncB( thermonuclease family)
MEALLLCLVVGVTDGDTLKARCGDAAMTTIRLAEIDAPEKRQPFGERSRQHLAQLCFRKTAEVHPKARDRYGRTVARVNCAGHDASLEQVRAGMAWAYTGYVTDPAVKGLEASARIAPRGLWVDPAPMAPWEWRHPPHKSGVSTVASRSPQPAE